MRSDGPIAIIGLGLIGGSLARDLAAQGAIVWGFDTDAATLRRARRSGVVQRVIDAELSLLEEVQVVVLAVPVDVAPAVLERARPFLEGASLVTDVGSTKQRIVARAASLGLEAKFVGSHPMAGDAHSGWAASRQGLFAGARVHLCRGATTRADTWRRARALWSRVGARPVIIDAPLHDAEVAFSSHLPQVLSVALASALSSRGIARQRLGRGGMEMTRLAGSPSAMWTAILEDNARPVTEAIDGCTAALAALRRAVAQRDRPALHAVFDRAQRWMDAEPHVAPAYGRGMVRSRRAVRTTE